MTTQQGNSRKSEAGVNSGSKAIQQTSVHATLAATARKRGFAAMDQSQQREIASRGGQAAHQKGTAHEFTSEEARRAGQKGGEADSRNREHMADIGRKGGESRQAAQRANVANSLPASHGTDQHTKGTQPYPKSN